MEEIMQNNCYRLLTLIIFFLLIVGQGFTNAGPYKIGAIWENDSAMGDEILDFAESELKSKLDYEVVKFNAKGDSEKFTNVLKKWDSGEVGCIYAIGNDSAKLASPIVKKVPTVAFAVKNPKALGIIKNRRAPKGQLTAVSYHVDPYKLLRTFRITNPNARKVGVIYDKTDVGTKKIEVPEIKKACQNIGLEVAAYPLKSSKDGAKCARTLKSALKVNAILMCADARVVKATKEIVAAAGQIPVLSPDSDAIDQGALFGLIASNEEMGKAVADYTIKILKDGISIDKLPVVFPKKPIFKVNIDTLKNVEVNIPEDRLEKADKVKTKIDKK